MERIEDVIRVVVIDPGQEPELRLIKNDYTGIQSAVGGNFELAAHIDSGSMSLYCNVEGLQLALPNNVRIPLTGGRAAIVVGPVVITRLQEDGTTVSLTEDDAPVLLQRFRLGGAYRV